MAHTSIRLVASPSSQRIARTWTFTGKYLVVEGVHDVGIDARQKTLEDGRQIMITQGLKELEKPVQEDVKAGRFVTVC